MIDTLQLITGIDIPVPELALTLRQPTLREISMLGETDYFTALHFFSTTPEKLGIKDKSEISNWGLFQQMLYENLPGVENQKDLILNFLQLFVKDKLIVGPRSLILNKGDEIQNIEPDQFEIFQKYVSQIGGEDLLKPQEEQFNPKNKRAAEIAEKMKKARKRLAAMEPKKKKGEGFLSRYIRAVAVATSNSLDETLNMTLAQINYILQTYLAREAYDIEIKSRLAGAKGDDNITHWMMADPENENNSVGTI